MVGSRAYHASIERSPCAAETIDNVRRRLLQQDSCREETETQACPILLLGRAGVGKTQLVLDLARELDLRVMVPRARAFGDLAASAWLKWARKDGMLLLLDDVTSLLKKDADAEVILEIVREFRTAVGSLLVRADPRSILNCSRQALMTVHSNWSTSPAGMRMRAKHWRVPLEWLSIPRDSTAHLCL